MRVSNVQKSVKLRKIRHRRCLKVPKYTLIIQEINLDFSRLKSETTL